MRQSDDVPLVVRPDRERDPDGSRLNSIITAQMEIARLRARRQLLLYVLAVVSVPVWISAAWPSWNAQSRGFSLAAWALCAGALLVTLVSEWRWEKKRDRALAVSRDPEGDNPPLPR